MTKKAIGYVRGMKYGNKWAPDAKKQRRQIREYAEEYGYELLKIYTEDHSPSLTTGQRGSIFRKARSEAAVFNTDTHLIYVDIGRWRRNQDLYEFKAIYDRAVMQGDKITSRMIPIPADQDTIDDIERLARRLKYDMKYSTGKSALGKKKVTVVDQDKDGGFFEEIKDPILRWQRFNKVGSKRFNNFMHLYKGVVPIYKIIKKYSVEMKPRAVSDLLNKNLYLTVDGKRWSRDTVRKSRDLIETALFEDFVNEMKDKKRPNSN